MNRRHVLEWLSRVLTVIITAVIGLPAFQYFLGGMKASAASDSHFERLKRLQDVPVGRPLLVPVLGSKQDGWTRSDQQVIGRVWLVRDSETDDALGLKAYTTICPHMGCQVQAQNTESGFICPCHQADFGLDGQRKSDAHGISPSPRNMDGLECRIVSDETTGEKWVEVKYEKFVTGLAQKVARH